MCDTILAPPGSTAGGIMLFGKNSDRQRNEAQAVEFFPRTEHAPDAQLRCTYITIPQVRHTHAVLLSRPFWIWGAEMGANEHGVVIGNEGLYSRSSPPEAEALVGMDLLRLALERAATAAQAVEVVATLLEKHGQGGNCGHMNPSFYNNSFMISDPKEAFVLETVGREWLVERVVGVRAISNEYSVAHQPYRTSAGMGDVLKNFGWDGSAAPNHAQWLQDPHRSHIGTARGRHARSMSLLTSGNGTLQATSLMRILRDHDPTGLHENDWNPRTSFNYSLCIHAGPEDRMGQTTGSLVSEIRSRDSVHWVTGTAGPCISIFKPVLMDAPLPAHGPKLTDRFDPATLWWRHEMLHRAALLSDLPKSIRDIREERDALEADFHSRVTAVVAGGSAADRTRVIAECWKGALETEQRWSQRVVAKPGAQDDAFFMGWQKMNQVAGLEWPPVGMKG